MLKSIALRNILSFGPEGMELQLNPINILIGPNGCGKSNLIDCISVLQNAPRDVLSPLIESGGFDEWRNKHEGNANKLEIRAVCRLYDDAISISHSMYLQDKGIRALFHQVAEEINATNSREVTKAVFSSTELKISIDGKFAMLNNFDYNRSAISQATGRDDTHELSFLQDFYRKIRIYRDWPFGRSQLLRAPQSASQKNEFLDEDYRNLGLILNRLKLNSAARQKFIEELQRFAPDITGFETLVQSGTVQIFLEEGKWTTPAIRISDGTMRYLALLAILCDPKPPALVCIEEPELGIHPDIIPELARLMQEASSRCQLIVTTHSEILVDAFTEQPESIVVCERGENGTEMKRLPPELLAKWLEDYRLGQLWSRGHLGGNRW